MKYAERLKSLRLESELTQSELAKKANLATSCIAMIESGKREPSAHTVVSLANALNVTTDYLLGLEDDFGVRTSTPMSDDITAEEKEMIKKIRTLRKESRVLVKQMIDTLAGTEKSEQKKQA